jgi:hypothetical protein
LPAERRPADATSLSPFIMALEAKLDDVGRIVLLGHADLGVEHFLYPTREKGRKAFGFLPSATAP